MPLVGSRALPFTTVQPQPDYQDKKTVLFTGLSPLPPSAQKATKKAVANFDAKSIAKLKKMTGNGRNLPPGFITNIKLPDISFISNQLYSTGKAIKNQQKGGMNETADLTIGSISIVQENSFIASKKCKTNKVVLQNHTERAAGRHTAAHSSSRL